MVIVYVSVGDIFSQENENKHLRKHVHNEAMFKALPLKALKFSTTAFIPSHIRWLH